MLAWWDCASAAVPDPADVCANAGSQNTFRAFCTLDCLSQLVFLKAMWSQAQDTLSPLDFAGSGAFGDVGLGLRHRGAKPELAEL